MSKRRPLPLWYLVTTLVVLGACAACSDADQGPKFRDVQSSAPTTLVVAGRTITLEFAITPAERTMGLMHRTSIEPDAGMLFIFTDDKPRTFWMKNTLIPLDIIFLDADGTVQNVAQGERMVESGYHSLRPARMVLELNVGWCAQHGLKAGDVIDMPDEWLALPEA